MQLPVIRSQWLRQCGVEEVQLRNIGWDKLLDKQRRKGECSG